MNRIVRVLPLLFAALRCPAQTTDSVIAGRVVNAQTGDPIAGARIDATRLDASLGRVAFTGPAGFFTLPLLSPGTYRIRITGDQRLQPQEVQELELPVAADLFLVARLRPLEDVWEQRQHQSVFLPGHSALVLIGPDVDTSRTASFEAAGGTLSALETSVSYVIDHQFIEDLPLPDRDAYTLLVLLPSVIADTTTARGINVSVAGQRTSAGNFLLDGLENDNYLVAGPLAAAIPESIEEYRISTNNYSAEYGRTSGFIANAITRSGGDAWHGSAYLFFETDALGANGFQENANGIPRAPLRQFEPGGLLGGPLLKQRLYNYTSIDVLRYHSQSDAQSFLLPTRQFIASTSPGTAAGTLLREYGSIAPDDASSAAASVNIAPPTGLHRDSVLERLDYSPAGRRNRLMGRLSYGDFLDPYLLYNPYPGFSSPLGQRALSLAASWTYTLPPSATNELRFGRSGSRYVLERPHNDVPALDTADNGQPVWLPGSQAYYDYRYHDHTYEALDNLTIARGAHLLTVGGGWLGRGISTALSANSSGIYAFTSLASFAASYPATLFLTYDRESGDPRLTPPSARAYTYQQAYGFVQDSYHLSPKVTLNAGLRYEYFGEPYNTGTFKDALIQLGAGDTLPEGLAGAAFVAPGPGHQRIYSAKTGYWAPRFGLSWDLTGRAQTVLRGGYGIYYDRPFENFWATIPANSLIFGSTAISQPVDFLQPAHSLVSSYTPSTAPINPVVFQPNLRNAAVQNAFLEFDQALSWAVSARFFGMASLGRTLPTNDIVNRDYSVPFGGDNLAGQYNPNLPELYYRANQGKSDYVAFSSVLTVRRRRVQGQASYTLSHAIDNQSDPLAGTFLDYNLASAAAQQIYASFTRQFDSQFDRANASYDQRHNLVLYGLIEPPSLPGRALWLTKDWRIGLLGAFRSGFPYTVLVESGGFGLPTYVNDRASLAAAGLPATENTAVAGGRQLLNPLAFSIPAPGVVGDTGRNAFRGPGLYSIDLSLMRDVRLPRLGDKFKLRIRADAFNALNHANLNNPANTYLNLSNLSGCNQFAAACYGRVETGGSPLVLPFSETGRQIQLMLRLDF